MDECIFVSECFQPFLKAAEEISSIFFFRFTLDRLKKERVLVVSLMMAVTYAFGEESFGETSRNIVLVHHQFGNVQDFYLSFSLLFPFTIIIITILFCDYSCKVAG